VAFRGGGRPFSVCAMFFNCEFFLEMFIVFRINSYSDTKMCSVVFSDEIVGNFRIQKDSSDLDCSPIGDQMQISKETKSGKFCQKGNAKTPRIVLSQIFNPISDHLHVL
jgi:hypothetical protein